MIITKHAYSRIKERIGWKKKTVDRMILRAEKEGIPRRQTSGRLRKYLDYLYHLDKESSKLLVWGHYIFILDRDVLVTVYQLPSNLKYSYLLRNKK